MGSKKVLVLGVSGMLGHKVFETFSTYENYDVYGTLRDKKSVEGLLSNQDKILVADASADNHSIMDVIKELKADVVINCIGVTKQKKDNNAASDMIYLNALFPHQAAQVCTDIGARFITIGTDCVFDGEKGEPYLETDRPTCHDAYGMTKYLGEVYYGDHLTLRTSIIGHELHTAVSLLDWFLNVAEPKVKGFKKAIFSGFTTLELSKVLAEKIIPNSEIKGLYQISVNPISKYDLLKIVKEVYKKNVEIEPEEEFTINRALISTKIREKIGYEPPSWEELISAMYQDFLTSNNYKIKRTNYEQLNNK